MMQLWLSPVLLLQAPRIRLPGRRSGISSRDLLRVNPALEYRGNGCEDPIVEQTEEADVPVPATGIAVSVHVGLLVDQPAEATEVAVPCGECPAHVHNAVLDLVVVPQVQPRVRPEDQVCPLSSCSSG